MASILETFLLIFDADASKLDKGLKDSKKGSDSLEDSLQKTDNAAEQVGGSLLQVATAVGAAVASFVAFGTIKATILETAGAIDDMGDAAAALDIPVEELSAWSMAVTMSDGTTEGFIGSLNSLNTGLNAIATKGKGLLLPFLKELGLSMDDIEKGAKNPIGALEKMADKFSQLSRAEAAGLGSKLGLDQGTINLLSQGRRGVEEIIAKQKELGVVTAAQVEQAGKFDEAMKEWNATFSDIKRELVVTVLPSLSWFFDKLRSVVSWMADHKGVVLAFFGATAAMLALVYAPAAWSAAAATWALIAPYAAVVLAIAAFAAVLALVTEDLYNFVQGNDSAIGELAKKWPIVGHLIRQIGDHLAWATAAVFAFADLFVQAIELGPEKAIANFSKSIEALVKDISAKIPIVGDIFTVVTGVMSDGIEGVIKVWEWLVQKVSDGIGLFVKAVEMVKSLHGSGARLMGFDVPAWGGPVAANPFVDKKTATAIGAGKQQIAAAATPLASQTSSSISNNNSATTKQTSVELSGPITVQTAATDGPDVASALGQELGSQIRGAIDQNDDGVLA